jgi:Pectate lyase superfamily protein
LVLQQLRFEAASDINHGAFMAYVQVKYASPSDVSLTAPVITEGPLGDGDRVLLTGQMNQVQNGVYVYQMGTDRLLRPPAGDQYATTTNRLDNATQIWVTNGTNYAGTVWGVDTVYPPTTPPQQVIIVDATPHTLTQIALPPVQARVATTGNLNLGDPVGVDPIDGLGPTELHGNGGPGSDIVLVKDQTDPRQNGLYWWANPAAIMSRVSEPLHPARQVHVSDGQSNANTRWDLMTRGAIVQGTTALSFQRPDHGVDVGNFGAVGDGVTDDTAAIQRALKFFSTDGTGAGPQRLLYFPSNRRGATYKITDTLVYEGDNGQGLRLVGEAGPVGAEGATIAWYGPHYFTSSDNLGGGTMLLVLGANNLEIEQLTFDPSPQGDSGPKAQNAVWVDATNEVTPKIYHSSLDPLLPDHTFTSIGRLGHIVTATLGAGHVVANPFIVKVAGVGSGFDGTFRCLYNDGTTASWMQTGGDVTPPITPPSGATVTKYKSAPSSNILFRRCSFGAAKAVSTNAQISAGGSPFTIVTTPAHRLSVGDVVIYKDSDANPSKTGPYVVTAVTSQNSATLISLSAGPGFAPDNNSSGGTLLSGAVGLRIAHRATTTEEINSVTGYDLFFQGDQRGYSIAAVQCDQGGNVKDFEWFNIIINGYRYGFYGLFSGNFSVIGYNGGLTGGAGENHTPSLATIEFYQVGGNVLITSAETEATNNRFLYTTVDAQVPIRLDSISYQSSAPWAAAPAPPDDIVITCSNLVITGSQLVNYRTTLPPAVPYISIGNPTFLGNARGSLVSLGNLYSNTAVGGGSTAPGYVPLKDGSNRIFHNDPSLNPQAANIPEAVNITSIGDFGTVTNGFGIPAPLFGLGTLSYLAIGDANAPLSGMPPTGSIRLPNNAAPVMFGTSVGAASGQVQALAKDAFDIVVVGDAPGVAITSNLRTKRAGNTDLAGELTIPAGQLSVTRPWDGSYSVHPEVIVAPQGNPMGSIWVEYLGTMSFTVRVATAPTMPLPISYIAVART